MGGDAFCEEGFFPIRFDQSFDPIVQFLAGDVFSFQRMIFGDVFHEEIGIHEFLFAPAEGNLAIMDIGDIGRAFIEVAGDVGREEDRSIAVFDDLPEDVQDLIAGDGI